MGKPKRKALSIVQDALDAEITASINREMPSCPPAVKAWAKANQITPELMRRLEKGAKDGALSKLGELANYENPAFGWRGQRQASPAWEVPEDEEQRVYEAQFKEALGGHSMDDYYAGAKIEAFLIPYLGIKELLPSEVRVKEIFERKPKA